MNKPESQGFFGPPRIWLTKMALCGIQTSETHIHTLSLKILNMSMYNFLKDSLNYFVCSGGIRVMQKILEGVCKKYPRYCLGGGFIRDWGAASGKFSRPEGFPWPAGHRKHPRPVRGKQTGKSLQIWSMRVTRFDILLFQQFALDFIFFYKLHISIRMKEIYGILSFMKL